MTEQDQPDPAQEDARQAADRRRRVAEVFGDVLPDTTEDDRAAPSPDSSEDERIAREVPPHHG